MSKAIVLTTPELITLAVGNLCVPIERVHELAKELTGEDLYTHQLVRFGKVAKERLSAQFPPIAVFCKAHPITRENWKDVVRLAEETFPSRWSTVSWDDWEHIGPIQELADMLERRSA